MDVLDEAPAGGRLTRSLRKRLTSVDSEASSSRPNTPIGTKLNSISEQNSPPRSTTRMTRRNSVTNLAATPGKTPSKTVSSRTVVSRMETTSEMNSPMRRINRRRSISITEDEETTTTSVKSIPKVEVVPEEETSTSKRITRSASKSPLQLITNGENVENTSPKLETRPKRATKPGPKSKLKLVQTSGPEQKNNVDSDVEVIDLETEDEEDVKADVKTKQKKSFAKDKPEETAKVEKTEKTPRNSSSKTPQKNITENKIADKVKKSPTKNKKTKSHLKPKFIERLETESETEPEMKAKNQSIHETELNETVNENEKIVASAKGSETPTKPKPANLEPSPIVIDDHAHNKSTEQLTSFKSDRINDALVTSVVNLKCLSPELISEIIGFPKESPATKNNNVPEKLKSVSFNDSIDDDVTKSSYPKTPCLTKTKSYIELDSRREADKNNSFQALSVSDSIEVVEPETLLKDTIREEHTDATHTPIKSIAKLKIIQSSTPLLNDTITSASEAAPNTVSNEEEFVHLDKIEASPLKSSKKSIKSLVDSPSSTSLANSPINRKKPISVIDEMEVVPLDTTRPSESEQKSPEKLAASPNKSSAKISENLRSPQKSPRSREETSINKRESLEPALQKTHSIESRETKPESSESKHMSKKSPCSLEQACKKSLDASFQSPKKMVLRNSPKHMQSPNISTSIKSPEKMKSPKKAAKITENSPSEAKKSDEPSSSLAVEELVKASPKAANLGYASSWTHTVSGVSNNTKIDQIIAEKERTPNTESEHVNDAQPESVTRHRSRFESDDDDENIGFDEDDAEVEADEELAENEKPHKEHAFILDEAMEVDDDYQSGDSMDSEERRELENNEIPCDGESIGSEDTSDGNEAADDGDDDDDDDEENDSFIADDSNEESLLDYSDNDDTEHLLEVERKNKKNLKKKPYRRILTVDDDEDDDERDASKNQNDGDDNKYNSSEEEDIGTLIESISKIVNEDGNLENDVGGDEDEIVEKNVAETSRRGAVNRSKTFDVKPSAGTSALKSPRKEFKKLNANDNNVSLKEKRRSLNRAKATDEPAEEQSTIQKKNLSKMQTHDKDHVEDPADEDDGAKNHANGDIEDEDHVDEVLVYKGDKEEDHGDEDLAIQDKDDEDGEDDEINNNPNGSKLSESAVRLLFDTDEESSADQENNEARETSSKAHEDGEDDETNYNPNSNKLSESAVRLLFDTDEESSADQENNKAEETSSKAHNLNTSRMKIIKHLQQSERFNKTVHDFRLEKPEEENGSTETEEKIDTKNMRRGASLEGSKNIEQNRLRRLSSNQHHRSKEAEAAVAACKTSSNSSEDECNQSTEKQMYKTLQRYSQGRNQEKNADSSNKTETNKVKRISSIRSPQIQKKRDREEKELTAINGDADSDTDSEANIHEEHHIGESKKKKNHRKPSSALSVSLGYIKERHDERIPPRNAHSSFTIGVVVRNNCKNRVATPEPIATPESSVNGDDVDNNHKAEAEASSSDTETEAAMFSSAEEEQLEKLEHTKKLPLSAGLNSSAVYTKQTTEALTDFKNSSKQRRTICIPADYGDFTTSQSFIESVAAESRGEFITSQATTKRKRLSKSFCAGASLNTTEYEEEYHLNKKSKLVRNDIAINSSTPRAEEKNNIQKNIIGEEKAEQYNIDEKTIKEQKKTVINNDDIKQRVLSRCEEILEAANRAKLEAKLNSNKSKVKLLKKKKSKKMAKVQQQQQLELKIEQENEIKENELKITQKQLKRQERAKHEIEKALKASANLILNKTEKKVIQNMPTQQLPKTVLDGLYNAELASTKGNKSKDFLPSKMDTKILKTSAGEVLEMRIVEKKNKKIPPPEEIQLSTGTVRVEPATPTKQLIRSGFRESPMTPLSLGFKVRHILSAGQDTPPVIPAKERKRKRNLIEEPRHTLPKPQWTQSGMFIEEEIYASAPVTTAGSTKFIVSALNAVRKKKKKLAKAGNAAPARLLGSSSVNSSALQFKNNALFRDDIQRETSRELIQRKQRKNI